MRPWWAGRDSKYPSARCSCCGHLVNTSRLYFVHFSLLYFTDTAHRSKCTLNIPDVAAVNVLHLQCNSWTVQDIAFISGILRRHAYWCTARGSKYLEMVDATVVVKCQIYHPCRLCISWYSLQCSCTVLLPTSSVSTDGLFLTHQIFLPKVNVNVTLGVHCTQTWM